MADKEAPRERPVVKAIAKIMGEVGAVEKRGRNDFHRYDYATAADIAHALQKRMAEAGLIIVPNQTGMRLLADDTVMACDFEFWVEHVSGDRLEDRPKFTGMASCRNSKGGFDDKAANKCLTAATKYFALNLFRIPTGDYPDADAQEDRPREAAPAQQKRQAEPPKVPPAAPAAAPAAPTDMDAFFRAASMDVLEKWFTKWNGRWQECDADAMGHAGNRAAHLIREMAQQSQGPADLARIHEDFGHWFGFIEKYCPKVWAAFSASWEAAGGELQQEAAE